MQLPEKDYLSFQELASKWRCSDADLFHLVATRKLTPSIFIAGKFDTYQVEPYMDGLAISGFSSGGESLEEEFLNGIFYLNWMGNSGRRVCLFNYFSIHQELAEFNFAYGLNENVSLQLLVGDDEVIASDTIIFIKNEIERFELEHMQISSKVDININEKPLRSRERNNLLKVIAALCKEQNLNLDMPYKAAGIIENQIKSLALSLSNETIASILSDAEKLTKSVKNSN